MLWCPESRDLYFVTVKIIIIAVFKRVRVNMLTLQNFCKRQAHLCIYRSSLSCRVHQFRIMMGELIRVLEVVATPFDVITTIHKVIARVFN